MISPNDDNLYSRSHVAYTETQRCCRSADVNVDVHMLGSFVVNAYLWLLGGGEIGNDESRSGYRRLHWILIAFM